MLQFEFIWILLALPLPWLIYRWLPAAYQTSAALTVPFFDRLTLAKSGEVDRRPWLRMLFMALIWICLLLGAARPVWIGDAVALPSSGRNLMLAVDISGSMQDRDMMYSDRRVTRLQAVKKVVGDFVIRRSGDRMGLILFGSRAYLQTPLTFDRNTLYILLNEAQIGFAGEKTAIGDAIGLAVKRLQDKPEESRILILLTDGSNTAGAVLPQKAAELALQAKVKIYTIFVGPNQRRTNRYMENGEEILRNIANATGGNYFRARNTEELDDIYQQLDKLEPVEQDQEFFRPKKALFYWPVIVALSLMSLWLLGALLQQLLLSKNRLSDSL